MYTQFFTFQHQDTLLMGGKGFMVSDKRLSTHIIVRTTEVKDTESFLGNHMLASKSELVALCSTLQWG